MNNRIFNEKRTDRLEIRIEPTFKELLGDLAFNEKVSLSDYVRTLIIEEIERKTGRWKK